MVETDGSITEGTLVRGIGISCDKEAIRVVKSMPNRTPGKQNNIPVRIQYNLPIKFTLY
jgi:protein TonB